MNKTDRAKECCDGQKMFGGDNHTIECICEFHKNWGNKKCLVHHPEQTTNSQDSSFSEDKTNQLLDKGWEQELRGRCSLARSNLREKDSDYIDNIEWGIRGFIEHINKHFISKKELRGMLERIRERIIELDTHLGIGSRETKTGKVIIKNIKLVASDEVLKIIELEHNINKLFEAELESKRRGE